MKQTAGLLVAFLAVTALFASVSLVGTSNITTQNPIGYYGWVTVTLTHDGVTRVVSSHHNFFSNAGKESVYDILGTGYGTGTQFNYIALCNDTNAAGCVQTYADSGLTATTGTVTRIDYGNWSVKATFTSSANNKDVNATGLFNGTSGAYFAGNNFTKVTLQNGDSITITWNISVS